MCNFDQGCIFPSIVGNFNIIYPHYTSYIKSEIQNSNWKEKESLIWTKISVTLLVTFLLFTNWVKLSLIVFLFLIYILVDFLAILYLQGEQTYSIEDGDKIVSVIVDRTMYALSPEAMKMFEDIQDDWELSICEKFPHDVLIGGIYTNI